MRRRMARTAIGYAVVHDAVLLFRFFLFLLLLESFMYEVVLSLAYAGEVIAHLKAVLVQKAHQCLAVRMEFFCQLINSVCFRH